MQAWKSDFDGESLEYCFHAKRAKWHKFSKVIMPVLNGNLKGLVCVTPWNRKP